VTIRKWIYLFFTTLLIGGVLGLVTGLIFNWNEVIGGGFLNSLFGCLFLFGLGCTYSVVSQMGFFAYLIVHRFGLGMFRSVSLWNAVQVLLIAFTLFDLIFFDFISLSENGESSLGYTVFPVALLFVGLLVAYLKAKKTNKFAFIPTLFFMVVVTTLELLLAKDVEDWTWLLPLIVILLACNAWQVLILHRLLGNGHTIDTQKRG
jgi:KinB signaling pathway activation protein